MATREIVVNMVPGGVTPVIHVSQYDDGYGITANLIENSGTYTVPTGATVSIEGTKPDGHGYAYLCTYQDNAVVIPVNTQMTAVKGKHPCELVVRKDGLRVGSKNMIMAVEVAGLGEDTIISDTELPAIIALAQEQEEAAASSASQAAASAIQAASSAASAETAKTAAMDAAEDAIDAAQELQTAIQFNVALIHETASGAVASFADGADDIPMQSVVAEITPVQDLNGQANPYPPNGGKNKLPYPYTQTTKTENGVTFTDNGNGIISLSGTATAQTDFILETSATGVLPANTAVIVSGGYSNNIFVRCAIDGQTPTSRGSDASVTTTNGNFTGNCYIRVDSGTNCNNVKVYPMIRLASASDATFAPYSNICPISGRTGMTVARAGKNLLYTDVDQYSNDGITIVKNADGTYTLNGTATAQVDAYLDNVDVAVPNGEYLYNGITVGSPQTYRMYLSVRKGNSTRYIGTNDGDASVTLTDETIRAFVRIFNGAVLRDVVIKPMLRPATITDDTYEPYAGQTYPITWETEAGTIYGGTLDVVSGVLTVDKGFVKFSDKTWTVAASRFYCEITDTKEPQTQGLDFVCSAFARANVSDYATMPDNTAMLCPRNFSATRKLFVVRADAYASASDFLTAMGDQTLVYPLAIPQTYQLTPTEVRTILGGNTIYTDAGDVSVEYIADTKLYIDKKVAELQALVLENN